MGAYFITGYLVSSHALHWKEDYHRAIAVDTRGVVSFSALDTSMKLFLHVKLNSAIIWSFRS